MAQSRTLEGGMDGHKASLAVASVAQEPGAEVLSLGTIGTRQGESDTRLRQLQSQWTPLVFVSAAGPCGSWLSRSLTKKDSPCWVLAPSLLPQQAGDRVTTDRRDAVQLARLMRAGDRTPGSGPAVADAAIRDRSRGREESLRERKAAPVRRTAVLLRHALRDPGPAHWRPAHRRGLRDVVCPTPAPPMVVQADVQTVTAPTAR